MNPNVSACVTFIVSVWEKILNVNLPWGIKFGYVFAFILGFPLLIRVLRTIFDGQPGGDTGGKGDKIGSYHVMDVHNTGIKKY